MSAGSDGSGQECDRIRQRRRVARAPRRPGRRPPTRLRAGGGSPRSGTAAAPGNGRGRVARRWVRFAHAGRRRVGPSGPEPGRDRLPSASVAGDVDEDQVRIGRRRIGQDLDRAVGAQPRDRASTTAPPAAGRPTSRDMISRPPSRKRVRRSRRRSRPTRNRARRGPTLTRATAVLGQELRDVASRAPGRTSG